MVSVNHHNFMVRDDGKSPFMVGALGHGRYVVDVWNSIIFFIHVNENSATAWCGILLHTDENVHLHLEQSNKISRESQKHLFNPSRKNGVMDQGRYRKWAIKKEVD